MAPDRERPPCNPARAVLPSVVALMAVPAAKQYRDDSTPASAPPYNHLEIGRPLLVDHVWGRQIGEYTISP